MEVKVGSGSRAVVAVGQDEEWVPDIKGLVQEVIEERVNIKRGMPT